MGRNYKFSVPQVIMIVLVTLLISTITVLAATGTTDSPAAPGSTNSYSLDDIWNRLNAGTSGSQATFTEPSVAPGTGTMHDLNDIMSIAPNLDSSNGAAPGDVASGKTYWGLTGGEWGPQTGTYSYSRFTDHGDGTVTDHVTGYMWTTTASHGTHSWWDAKDYIFDLTTGGYTDWQLPEIWEMFTLVDESESNPCLQDGHPFTGVQNTYYWSDTKYEEYMTFAYFVNFSNDYVSYANKGISYNIWPMRKP